MQVSLESDSTSVLGLPYGDRAERRFWNVKKDPKLVDNIPELGDFPELKSFVAAINRPESRFGTLGCEKWHKEVDYKNGISVELGLYVQIIPDRIELATHQNCVLFSNHMCEHGDALRPADPSTGWTLIRIEPERVVSHDLSCQAWMMCVWVYGAGRSTKSAYQHRSRGLHELLVVANMVSSEIRHAAGAHGTAFFNDI